MSASVKNTLARWNAAREVSLGGPRPWTTTPEQRFESKLVRRGECLLFTGKMRSPDGYGVYVLSGQQFVAHRLTYVLQFGEIPFGVLVKQTCGEPLCCELLHLRPQPRQELIARRWAKRNVTRFWQQVDKGAGDDACWFWTAKSERCRFSISGRDDKRMTARRAAWVLVRGEVPERHRVYSTCGNDRCINPAHARVASQHSVRKVKPVFTRKPARRLTDDDRTELRRLFAEGQTNGELSKKYGVRPCTVSSYTRGLPSSRHQTLRRPSTEAAVRELTAKEIDDIVTRRTAGEDLRTLANEFGVRPVVIFRVTNGLVKTKK